MPIIQTNCAIGGTTNGLCHADPTVSMMGAQGGQRQYYGPPTGTSNAADLPTIYANLMQTSFDDPYMALVKPGAPASSFLWYKINGTQMSLDMETPDQCERGDLGTCGTAMPLPLTGATVTLLPQADRDLICNWILQGAKDN